MRLVAAFTNISRNYASISGQKGEIILSFQKTVRIFNLQKKKELFFPYAIQERFIGKLNLLKQFNRHSFSVKANLEITCQAIHFLTQLT